MLQRGRTILDSRRKVDNVSYLAQSEASEAMEGSFETMLGAGDTISPDNATLVASG